MGITRSNRTVGKTTVKRHRSVRLAHRAALLEAFEPRLLMSGYVINNLDTLGGTASQALGLNSIGQVVGDVTVNGTELPFIYSSGVMSTQALPAGAMGGIAYGINTYGKAVGLYYSAGMISNAASFANGTTTSLGMGINSAAYAINDSGTIAGNAVSVVLNQGFTQAANGTNSYLGILTGYTAGSVAYAISSTGTVAGYSGTLTTLGIYKTANGTLTSIGFASPTLHNNDYARAISPNGTIIVGDGYNPSSDYDAFSDSGSTLTDLGTMAGFTATSAYGVNDYGVVVGRADPNGVTNSPTNTSHAFIDSNGVMTDLNSDLPAGSGWTLVQATAINDAGVVVGWGYHNGVEEAFEMLPLAAVPSMPALAASSDSGLFSADDVTNVVNPTYTGTSDPNAAVELFANGVQVGNTTASANGTWSITTSTLASATYAITALAKNLAGEISNISLGAPLTINDIAPTLAVTPPAAGRVLGNATLTFSEPVYGVNLSELTLELGTGPNLISNALTLTTTDHMTYTLSGLNMLSLSAGSYALYIRPTTSVVDLAGNAFSVISGATVTVESPQNAYVDQLYHDLLNRAPSAAESSYWVNLLNAGSSYADIAEGFTSSREYQGYIVNGFYETYLGRAGEADGISYWVDQMQNGLNAEVIRAGILGSDEYFTDTGGTDTSYIDALYASFLGRTPDSTGIAAWTGMLNGTSAAREVVSSDISGSDENFDDVADSFYQRYLHRTSNGTEQSYWAQQLANGVSQPTIVTSFVSCAEYLTLYDIT